MSNFEYPAFLLLLLVFPAGWILKKHGWFSSSFSLTLSDWGGKPDSWNSRFYRIVRILSIVCFSVSFFAMIISLANPIKIYEEKVYTQQGQDLIFLLDVSPSMAAYYSAGVYEDSEVTNNKFQKVNDFSTNKNKTDTNSTRLDSAKSVIKKFVENRPGDTVGLGILGSSSALVVPATTVYSVFLERLESVKIGEMGKDTALGMGLAMSATHVRNTNGTPGVLILLTDGENNAGAIHPETAAGFIREKGIRFYIIGVGSKGEVPVEYVDPLTGTHYSGILESAFNDYSLQRLAVSGGGKYAKAENYQELQQVLEEISQENPSVAKYYTRTVQQSFAPKWLIVAVIGFAIAWFLRRVFLGNLL